MPNLPTNTTTKVSETAPSFAREVIALYADALAKVSFPDLDLKLLQTTADELAAAEQAVERASAELDAARNAAYRQAELLDARAERALAYARVFADGNQALSERINEISHKPSAARARVADSSGGAQPKKRGRPKKSESDASLFSTGQNAGHTSTETETESDALVESAA